MRTAVQNLKARREAGTAEEQAAEAAAPLAHRRRKGGAAARGCSSSCTMATAAQPQSSATRTPGASRSGVIPNPVRLRRAHSPLHLRAREVGSIGRALSREVYRCSSPTGGK
jgi:hypothetical protein